MTERQQQISNSVISQVAPEGCQLPPPSSPSLCLHPPGPITSGPPCPRWEHSLTAFSHAPRVSPQLILRLKSGLKKKCSESCFTAPGHKLFPTHQDRKPPKTRQKRRKETTKPSVISILRNDTALCKTTYGAEFKPCFPFLQAPKFALLLFSRSVVADSLQPRGLQRSRSPCPPPSPRACSNARALSW